MINPNQFKLFYSGQELRDSITSSGDQLDDETLPEMWDRKVDESKVPEDAPGYHHGAGVYDSLSEGGLRPDFKVSLNWMHDSYQPDNIGHYVSDAHHRIATAAHIEETTGQPMWINVNNVDQGNAFRLRRDQEALNRPKMPQGIRLGGIPGLHLGAQFGSARPVGQKLAANDPSLARKLKVLYE